MSNTPAAKKKAGRPPKKHEIIMVDDKHYSEWTRDDIRTEIDKTRKELKLINAKIDNNLFLKIRAIIRSVIREYDDVDAKRISSLALQDDLDDIFDMKVQNKKEIVSIINILGQIVDDPIPPARAPRLQTPPETTYSKHISSPFKEIEKFISPAKERKERRGPLSEIEKRILDIKSPDPDKIPITIEPTQVDPIVLPTASNETSQITEDDDAPKVKPEEEKATQIADLVHPNEDDKNDKIEPELSLTKEKEATDTATDATQIADLVHPNEDDKIEPKLSLTKEKEATTEDITDVQQKPNAEINKLLSGPSEDDTLNEVTSVDKENNDQNKPKSTYIEKVMTSITDTSSTVEEYKVISEATVDQIADPINTNTDNESTASSIPQHSKKRVHEELYECEVDGIKMKVTSKMIKKLLKKRRVSQALPENS